MDYIRVFFLTQIEVWKASELVPNRTLETSPLSNIDVGVVVMVSVHDFIESNVCDLVMLSLESNGKHHLYLVLCIS